MRRTDLEFLISPEARPPYTRKASWSSTTTRSWTRGCAAWRPALSDHDRSPLRICHWSPRRAVQSSSAANQC